MCEDDDPFLGTAHGLFGTLFDPRPPILDLRPSTCDLRSALVDPRRPPSTLLVAAAGRCTENLCLALCFRILFLPLLFSVELLPPPPRCRPSHRYHPPPRLLSPSPPLQRSRLSAFFSPSISSVLLRPLTYSPLLRLHSKAVFGCRFAYSCPQWATQQTGTGRDAAMPPKRGAAKAAAAAAAAAGQPGAASGEAQQQQDMNGINKEFLAELQGIYEKVVVVVVVAASAAVVAVVVVARSPRTKCSAI